MLKNSPAQLAGALVLASLVCFACFSCSQKMDEAETPRPIQIALTQDILSFDPMRTSDIFSEAILRCVYTSLYDFDDELNLRKKLVKTETPLDSYTWRLEIHDNVTFHNGDALTAEDVVFTIERARRGGRTQKLLEIIDKVEVVDKTTLRIRAKEPYAALLTLFAKAEMSIVSKKVVESPGYDFKRPVGAGPFKLRAHEENRRVSLERFDDYYLGKAASPLLDFVVLVTEQERTAALLGGEVDLLFSVSAYDCEKLLLSSQVRLLQRPSTKIEYLSLNTLHPPLNDPRVRLAISHAINRKHITNAVYHGYGTPASSLIPKGITGHVAATIPHDPARAKALLREAGYENGLAINVITIDTIRKHTLEYIKLDLAKVDIQLNYNLVTMKEAATMMLAGEHESILVGWAFSVDPNSVLPLLLGTGSGKSMNSSNYSNPMVDDLLRKARAEQNNDAKRLLYEQINGIVTSEAPIVVLLNPQVLGAVRTTIGGIHFNPQGLMQYEALHRLTDEK